MRPRWTGSRGDRSRCQRQPGAKGNLLRAACSEAKLDLLQKGKEVATGKKAEVRSAQGAVAELERLQREEAVLQATHTWPRAPLNPALAVRQACRKNYTYYMYIAGAPRWRAPFFLFPPGAGCGVGRSTRW